jgi:hypothetical protein
VNLLQRKLLGSFLVLWCPLTFTDQAPTTLMHWPSLLFALSALSNVVSSLSSCVNFTRYAPSSEYPYAFSIHKTQLNFSNARAFCANLHPQADLLIVRDQGVLDDFLSRTYSYTSSTKDYWIGLYQTSKLFEPDGNWSWLDGSPVSRYVVHWALTRPNNLGGDEDCGMSSYVGEYDDQPCGSTNYFLCEINCMTLSSILI